MVAQRSTAGRESMGGTPYIMAASGGNGVAVCGITCRPQSLILSNCARSASTSWRFTALVDNWLERALPLKKWRPRRLRASSTRPVEVHRRPYH